MNFLRQALLLLTALAGFIPAFSQISSTTGGGQILNTVSTAVPFLRIAPDARSGAMGDMGVAIDPDAHGWYFNPAKMAFAKKDMGVAITYTPWLKQLVNDIYLASVFAFKRIDENQTVGGSLRYFSLGNIQFTDAFGNYLRDYKPNEFAIDAGYARKLSDVFSTGIMLRFIYSNLASGQQVSGVDIKAGTSVAADISFDYQNEINLGDRDAMLMFGANISNLGAKITYTKDAENKDFIPSNLGLGTALSMPIDEHNSILFGIDINKLLVPTPDSLQSFRDKTVPSAVLGSFSDAPGGFSEEMHELMYSVGIEYWYANQFAVRAGYFNEHATKGNRKFLTVGLGVQYNIFGLNFSYLIPTNQNRNPLDNTLRFSLVFDFKEGATK